MLFLVKLNPPLFLLALKKKAIIVSFRWDSKVLTAARSSGAAAESKAHI